MPRTWWPSREIALIAFVVALGCVTVLTSVGLTRPEPFANATLGSGWQCNKTHLVFTVCVRNAYEEAGHDPFDLT
jgi:hypothetical protein